MYVRSTRWTPNIPSVRQAVFLCDDANKILEAMYGGAAGGGKSDALLMGALQFVDVPGYSALIIRKNYSDLSKPGALMDRSRMWLGQTDAEWRESTRTWRFPSGARLSFGYISRDTDVYQYQSAEYQFIAFDEGTQFSEFQYRYMFSRLRRVAGIDVPLRMRMATNPGGYGHEWVKRRFIIEGEEEGRLFVSAKLADNPYLNEDEYAESLAELDPVTRRQLLSGDWDARLGGNKFDRDWFERRDKRLDDYSIKQVRYWDMAATEPRPGADPDYTVGTLLQYSPHTDHWCVADVMRLRGSPGTVKTAIMETGADDGIEVPIRIEREPGSAGKLFIDEMQRLMPAYDLKGSPPKGSKEVRANPVSIRAESRKMSVVVAPWNSAWFDELEGFPYAAHDDQVDSLSGGYHELAAGSRVNQKQIRPSFNEPVIVRDGITLRGDRYIDEV